MLVGRMISSKVVVLLTWPVWQGTDTTIQGPVNELLQVPTSTVRIMKLTSVHNIFRFILAPILMVNVKMTRGGHKPP